MERKGSYFGVKGSGSYRPRLPTSPRSPDGNTPTTPLFSRSLSSPINSPSISFRTDDDIFIFEVGARYMRVGLGGENYPRCKMDFGPRTQARAGNFGIQLQTHALKRGRVTNFEDWGAEYELWRADVKGVQIGLLEDKLERTIRKAITEHVLVLDDAKRRRILLAIPSSLSHPVLSCLLKTLFGNFPPPPSIILVPNSVLCTVAAGLRSSLVIDIGWEETVVSAIYEYREVQSKRSVRGMKSLSWHVSRMLNAKANEQMRNGNNGIFSSQTEFYDFAETEEVVFRLIWCANEHTAHVAAKTLAQSINIPIPATEPAVDLEIPFISLSDVTEKVFFDSKVPLKLQDDHELPLDALIYVSLLSLPVDIRSTCISRIVFTGGGSNIPGLKSRLLSELRAKVASRGWDPIENHGSAGTPRKSRLAGEFQANQSSLDEEATNKDMNPDSTTPVHLQPPLPDEILVDIQRENVVRPDQQQQTQVADTSAEESAPVVRAVRTLGAWAGASLMAGLRIKSVVEIERENFLAHGLSGTDRKRESGGVEEQRRQQRLSLLSEPVGALGKSGDKALGGWSLGIWA